ncbi:UNVERIFIED_ORG: SagB-type dehydrogenase family enzyme [Rhodococcus erythropolis]
MGTDHADTVQRLIRTAGRLSVSQGEVQVLLVIAARAGRLMYRYEQMSYSLILKHTGALYQSLYLASTAMGLGVRGLGSGLSADFITATGLDELIECPVGDILIGTETRQESSKTPPRPAPSQSWSVLP